VKYTPSALARGECEPTPVKQSRPIDIQLTVINHVVHLSNWLKSYSTIYCIRNTESVKQLHAALINVQTLTSPVDRNHSVYYVLTYCSSPKAVSNESSVCSYNL